MTKEQENMNPKFFGRNLKQALLFLGMSQVELSNRSGLTQAAISQIISGEREPSLSSVIAILKIIPITFEKITREKDL